MPSSASTTVEAHPAPHRERVGLGTITLVTLAPPLAWSVHLFTNYAFSSHACYPAGVPLLNPVAGFDWVQWLLIAVDLASIAACIVCALLAYRNWTISARELEETRAPLIEIGEGRTRFLSIWGVIIGLGFTLAIIFDFVGLWIVPICG